MHGTSIVMLASWFINVQSSCHEQRDFMRWYTHLDASGPPYVIQKPAKSWMIVMQRLAFLPIPTLIDPSHQTCCCIIGERITHFHRFVNIMAMFDKSTK